MRAEPPMRVAHMRSALRVAPGGQYVRVRYVRTGHSAHRARHNGEGAGRCLQRLTVLQLLLLPASSIVDAQCSSPPVALRRTSARLRPEHSAKCTVFGCHARLGLLAVPRAGLSFFRCRVADLRCVRVQRQLHHLHAEVEAGRRGRGSCLLSHRNCKALLLLAGYVVCTRACRQSVH